VLGIALGIVATYFATRGIASIMLGIQALDLWAMSLLIVVLASCLLIGFGHSFWTAMRVEPAKLLRNE
jgi:hypothetical protein